MANHPIPDNVPNIMHEQFGTSVLITDPRSDKYLNRKTTKPNDPPSDRMSHWCGGKNGFDDYVERFH
ncbi:hypothetical protein SWPG_00003 [Synechococcus phage S-CBM2]|nr:hypothetical protein SWPG_00003 [Synechococcus phage S-CBM2]